MLLAQINRDSQGMAEFHDADGQPVTLCLTEAVAVAGAMNLSSAQQKSLKLFFNVFFHNVNSNNSKKK